MDIIPESRDGLIEDISVAFPYKAGVLIAMLRLDKLHAVVSGNKWFKLKYNLQAALDRNYRQVLTFGGAYSNHLVATAAAAAYFGLLSVGIVRGLHAQHALTPTLKSCIEYGMKLYFVSRQDYDLKQDAGYLKMLQESYFTSFIIPEGGNNDLGRDGAGNIASFIPADITTVCLPVGTGTTFAGLRNSLPRRIKMIGFTAMKGGEYLAVGIANNIKQSKAANWQLNTEYAFKGFAKTTPELIRFIQSFYKQTAIPLDIVYTGKMMFGINQLLQQEAFAEGEKILCIHTGGLQGNPPGLFDS